MNREFQGRYRGLLVSSSDHPNEDRIQRGLAEIMLLDRQLQALASQSKAIEAQSEPPSSPASQSSRSYSHTFLTHPQRARLKEKVLSSRSPRKEEGSLSKATKEPVEDGKVAEGGEEGEEVDRIRLEELLSIDDQDLQRVYAYLPDNFYQESRRIDEALAQFHRLDRLQDKEEDMDQEQTDKTATKSRKERAKKSSFLSQQRLEREEHQHEAKIDNLLSQSRGMVRLSDCFVCCYLVLIVCCVAAGGLFLSPGPRSHGEGEQVQALLQPSGGSPGRKCATRPACHSRRHPRLAGQH